MTELRYDEEAAIKEMVHCEGHGKNEDLRLPRRPLRLQQKEQRWGLKQKSCRGKEEPDRVESFTIICDQNSHPALWIRQYPYFSELKIEAQTMWGNGLKVTQLKAAQWWDWNKVYPLPKLGFSKDSANDSSSFVDPLSSRCSLQMSPEGQLYSLVLGSNLLPHCKPVPVPSQGRTLLCSPR